MNRLAEWLLGLPKWLLVVSGSAIWYGLYRAAADLQFQRAGTWPELAVDRAVPLVEWTIIVYASVFVQILMMLILMEKRILSRVVIAFGILALIHTVFFFIVPVHFPRETVVPSEGWAASYRVMWWIDKSNNCFPSMHVSMAFLLSFGLKQSGGWKGWLFTVWSVLIGLSTMTTKQHYALDILAGFAVAVACHQLITVRLLREASEER